MRLTRDFGSRISEFSLVSDHDTVTSPSDAVVITLSSSSASLRVSTKGVMPTAWGDCLSTRDRGVDRSGTVATSGTRLRVPRKSIKLAKPITRDGKAVSDVAWRGGTHRRGQPTSEREYKVGQKGEGDRDLGTGVACEARNRHWDDEHSVYHLKAKADPRVKKKRRIYVSSQFGGNKHVRDTWKRRDRVNGWRWELHESGRTIR